MSLRRTDKMEDYKMYNQFNSDLVETGDKIRMIRETLGLSQDELAERMGLCKNSIYRYEKGIAPMKLDIFYQFADTFDVEPNVMLSDRRKNQNSRYSKIQKLVNLLMLLDDRDFEISYVTNMGMFNTMMKNNNK